MKRLVCVLVSAVVASSAVSTWAADPPAEKVLAMYFHRTQRCPTCLKMGSYAEEAVTKGFEKQIKEGTVQFVFVDFQIEKNAKITKAYKITGPALIVAKLAGNKVKEYKNLKDIWTKVQEKPEFIQYVQENVTACLPTALPDQQPTTHN